MHDQLKITPHIDSGSQNSIRTYCGFPRHCDSVAVDFGQACVTVKRTGGRRCTAVEEGARPHGGGALSRGHSDIVVVKGDCHGSAAGLGCGFRGNVGVQAEGRGRGWRAELSFGHFCMFGGSPFLPHGGSSARTSCRLDRSR